MTPSSQSERTSLPLVGSKRWQRAQAAERRFWQTSPHAGDRDRSFWNWVVREGFGAGLEMFRDKAVLEIGSGPSGMIYRVEEARLRVGVEPMDLAGLADSWKRRFVHKALGERLPYKDGSFDFVICFNALDHTFEPGRVLRECRRVLREDGQALLWIHALRRIYRPLQPILNWIDPPHPHHFTRTQALRLVEPCFIVARERRVAGAGVTSHVDSKGSLKVLLANYMTESLWWSLRPR